MHDARSAWRSRFVRGCRSIHPACTLTAIALALAALAGPAHAGGFGRTDLLQAVARAERSGIIVAVGLRGAIGVSQDDGDTWQRRDLTDRSGGLRPALLDVTACPDGKFAAIDARGYVFTSADGLGDWVSCRLDTSETPQSIACDATNRLWVAGGFSTILVSDDVGETWEDRSIGEDLILTDILFPTVDTGYALGEFGAVFKTVDAGLTWAAQPPIPGEFYPQDTLFISTLEGWVVGLDGAVMRTGDGGQSWTRQASGTQVGLSGLAALPGGRVVAVGDRATVLTGNSDGWHLAHPSAAGAPYLTSAVALSADTILAAGSGGTLTPIRLTP